MPARIVMVDEDTRDAFIDYALAYGREHDESWVQAEDLDAFDPAAEPAALAVDSRGTFVGAASLLFEGYAEEGLARFRILHAIDREVYATLVDAVTSRVPPGIEQCFAFMPDSPDLAELLAGLGFVETRRATVLRREGPPAPPSAPPAGVRIAVADAERDAEAWARVVNAACHGFPGRFDMSPELARDLLSREHVVPGGALLAWREAEPVGLVLLASEPDEGDVRVSSVETLAVVPSAQGAGLGRVLLRAGVALVHDAGFDVVDLSTNATNERALSLYLSEGFVPYDVRVCWTRFAEVEQR